MTPNLNAFHEISISLLPAANYSYLQECFSYTELKNGIHVQYAFFCMLHKISNRAHSIDERVGK